MRSALQQSRLGERDLLRPAEQHDDVARFEAEVGFRKPRRHAAPAHPRHLDPAGESELRERVLPTAAARSPSSTECSRGCRFSAPSAASVAPW